MSSNTAEKPAIDATTNAGLTCALWGVVTSGRVVGVEGW